MYSQDPPPQAQKHTTQHYYSSDKAGTQPFRWKPRKRLETGSNTGSMSFIFFFRKHESMLDWLYFIAVEGMCLKNASSLCMCVQQDLRLCKYLILEQ